MDRYRRKPRRTEARGKLGLVLTGGGARAAYQVGVLRALAHHCPQLHLPIVCGVSAGAINAAYLASSARPLREVADSLTTLWRSLEPSSVFEVDAGSLAGHMCRRGLQLLSGGRHLAEPPRGMFSTEPLRGLLARTLPNHEGELLGIEENLAAGRLQALGITTSDYGTGQSVTWVQGKRIRRWTRPHRRSREARLGVDHIMASAALPLFFPAVQLAGGWHGDGGIRLTAPLSPALHLGATRILAVSNRYRPGVVEADRPMIRGYPPPAQIFGSLTNAVFLDMLDQDAQNLVRINALLEPLPAEARGELRPVDVFVLRPSRNLGKLAQGFEVRLPRAFRFLTRGLGTRDTESPDALSLLMFQHDYVQTLIELGESDAHTRAHELVPFLTR